MQVLRSYLMPQTSLIYKRFLFHKRFQLKDESIAAYVTELRRLAEEYQLVCGLRDESIQGRLPAETSVSYDKAVKRAQAGEAAASQVKELQAQKPSIDVPITNQLRQTNSTKRILPRDSPSASRNTCASCGGSHSRKDCKFRNAECNFCHKKGHISKVCRSKTPPTKSTNKQKPSLRTCQLTTYMVNKSSHEVYMLNSVRQVKSSKIHITVRIEGKPCTMEIDSGSDFSKNAIELKGYCEVGVAYKCRRAKLRLLITESDGESLLGLQWFSPLGLSIQGVHQIHSTVTIKSLLEEFSDVFKEDLGTYKGPKVTLPLDPKVLPIRLRARNVPLAIRPRIEAEIKRLLREKVLEPVTNPKWSTPVVLVMKPTGDDHPYPIPSVTHLLSSLSGGGYYAKIDIAQAYLQLPVEDASAEAQTIITHVSAFKVKRLQFGVSIAPGIFQQVMDDLLRSIPGTTVYFDDVLIRRTTLPQLTDRLWQVLQVLRNTGLRAKKEKCLFGVTSVDFLGYRIDASGIHPSRSKMEAIKNAPVPRNKQELQVDCLTSTTVSSRTKRLFLKRCIVSLIKARRGFGKKRHDKSFTAVKQLLTSESVLVPFYTSPLTILTREAPPCGTGAVLSQIQENGTEAKIAFASRTLTQTERNYAQIDREALALISGVKKFYHFLYGRPSTLVTDHKPLLGLFSPSKCTPDMLSPCTLRWSILLNAYSFKLVHKPGAQLGNADALSCLSCNTSEEHIPDPPEIFATHSSVVFSTGCGRAYFTKRNELTVHKKCLLWGNRVVSPKTGQQRVLDELHLSHPGMVRMKALARSYVWWLNLDSDIEHFVANCAACRTHQHMPPKAPVHPWKIPRNPWSRLHIDFARPFQGEQFLIIVDAYSKWLELKRMRSTTGGSTIGVLRELDNFIRSIRVSPHHASSNGQAEKMVQTTKDSLRKITIYDGYCGLRTAELLMGRKLKTYLDHLHPDYAQYKQLRQDTQLVASRNEWKFEPGEPVYIQTYETGPPWVPAVISKPTGPVSYEATTPDGKSVKRHSDLIQGSPEALPTENAAASPSPVQTEKPPTPVSDPAAPSGPKRTRTSPGYLEDYVC
ncbi:hypothetical protein M513_09011 [Trichuris suis]|uniref:RNA-directed DNA polymerase n=1 Tax=Trichuris suis TaxID=68888 RepID=A0A085LYK5_9BILA|nr:hypothetical protein M513_09011 [Trichuris suis]